MGQDLLTPQGPDAQFTPDPVVSQSIQPANQTPQDLPKIDPIIDPDYSIGPMPTKKAHDPYKNKIENVLRIYKDVCNEHPEEAKTAICIDHEEILCKSCSITGEHRGHNIMLIEVVVAQILWKFDEARICFQKWLGKIWKLDELINDKYRELNNSFDDIQAKIVEKFANLNAKILNLKKETIDKLHNKKNAVKVELDNISEKTEALYKKVEDQIRKNDEESVRILQGPYYKSIASKLKQEPKNEVPGNSILEDLENHIRNIELYFRIADYDKIFEDVRQGNYEENNEFDDEKQRMLKKIMEYESTIEKLNQELNDSKNIIKAKDKKIKELKKDISEYEISSRDKDQKIKELQQTIESSVNKPKTNRLSEERKSDINKILKDYIPSKYEIKEIPEPKSAYKHKK